MSEAARFENHHDLASKGSQLCLSCGLCCQGLLRDHAPLETGETELATQLGLPVHLEDSDSQAFSLPCPLYKDNRCSVYPKRPRACREYQCDILKKFLQGMISFEQSIVLVKSAKQLMSAIRQRIGIGDPSKRIWEHIADFLDRQGNDKNSEEVRRANAELLLDEKQLAFICRHFEMNNSIVAATSPPPTGTESNRQKVLPKGKGSLKPSAHVLVGDNEGQIVVSNTKTGEYSGLIGVAADMWRALLESDDLEDVVTTLLKHYDIDEATLRADLHAFVEGLLARDLLELRDARQRDSSDEQQAPTGP